MKKLAFATLVAMGMTAAAIAQQQPGQQPSPRPAQPSTQHQLETPSTHNHTGAARRRSHGPGELRYGGQERRRPRQSRGSQHDRGLRLLARRYQRRRLAEPSGVSGGDGDVDAARRRTERKVRASGERATAQKCSFDTADKDKDGKVSRGEAEDIPGFNFSSADVNDDASLSRQEFQTAMAGSAARLAPRRMRGLQSRMRHCPAVRPR